MTIDDLAFLVFGLLIVQFLALFVNWQMALRINRLRETLRRNNILFDPSKPWEGA